MLSWSRHLVGLLVVALGAAACHVPGPTSPETPKAGVPSIELEFLEHQYRLGEDPCTRSAEEVVDIQKRCSEARWADCVYAATMYWHGCGVAPNEALAEQLFQRACSYGSMLGCALAGRFAKDYEQGVALLEAPCARGYTPACGGIGILLYDRGREADVPRATRLLSAACRNDDVAYCSSLAQLVINRKLTALFGDARTQLERACQAKDQESCRLLASAYDQGLLGVTDPERAVAIYSASCNEGHLPSCDAMGHMFVLGRGHEKDEQAGMYLFYGTCTVGYGRACESMGQAMEKGWGVPADPAGAVSYYERACTLGCEHACQRARELGAQKAPER